MALLATLHDHRRLAERQDLDSGATLRIDGHPLDALVANISASGCLFVCSHDFAVGDRVTIGIAGIGRRRVRIVRALDSRFGAEFPTPLSDAELAAALALPAETVVVFPVPIAGSANVEEISSPPPRFRPWVRLAIVAGLAIATWIAVAALMRTAA